MSRRSNTHYKRLTTKYGESVQQQSSTSLDKATLYFGNLIDGINEKTVIIASIICVILSLFIFSVASLVIDKGDNMNSEIFLFESSEFDFYLNDLPLTFSEAVHVVRAKKSRLFDYKVIRPDLVTKLEDSLSKDVRNFTGTKTFWTGAYYDFTESISHDKLRYFDDSRVGKLANFPGMYHGQCHSAEFYEGYIENNIHKMAMAKIFQISVQVTCQSEGEEARVCKSCLTLLANNSTTQHFLVYYKPKEIPKINLKNSFLKIRSADHNFDFVFHDKKVSREGLEKLVNHIGAEKLQNLVFHPENFENIAAEFKKSKIPGNDHEMAYWTNGYFDFSTKRPTSLHWNDQIYEIDQLDHWCGREFIGDEPHAKIKEMYHNYIYNMENQKNIVNVVLRVRDYYHQMLWDEPPCLLIDEGKQKAKTGVALFHLAYQIPVSLH